MASVRGKPDAPLPTEDLPFAYTLQKSFRGRGAGTAGALMSGGGPNKRRKFNDLSDLPESDSSDSSFDDTSRKRKRENNEVYDTDSDGVYSAT